MDREKERKKYMFEEIFTIQNIVIYLIIINIIGFLAMWIDKRKAQKGAWRISEQTLFYITLLRWWYRHHRRNVYLST